LLTNLQKAVAKEPHPLDVKYDLLQCRLSLMDKKSNEYKVTVTGYYTFAELFSFLRHVSIC